VGAHAEMLVKMLVACAKGISRKNAQENKRKINIEEQKGEAKQIPICNLIKYEWSRVETQLR